MPVGAIGNGDSEARMASSGQRIRFASSTVRGGSSIVVIGGAVVGGGGGSNAACRGVVGDPMPVDLDVGVPIRARGVRAGLSVISTGSDDPW